MRPYTPWKRSIQLAEQSTVAASAVAPAGELLAEQRDDRHGRRREDRRHEPQPDETASRVRDDPGEQEVERRAAALVEHRVEEARNRLPADEQRQRLVLVRRPGGQLHEEERADRERAGRRRRARTSAGAALRRGPAPTAPARFLGDDCRIRGHSPHDRNIIHAGLAPDPLLALPDADVRLSLPERARVRGRPSHGRSAARTLRGLRGRPARARLPPGAGLLQGLGLLLDRLRPQEAEGRVERRRRRFEERRDSSSSKPADKPAEKSTKAADT